MVGGEGKTRGEGVDAGTAAVRRSFNEAFSARRATQTEIKSRTRPEEQATTVARRGPRIGMRLVVAAAEGFAPLVLISTSACRDAGNGAGRGVGGEVGVTKVNKYEREACDAKKAGALKSNGFHSR